MVAAIAVAGFLAIAVVGLLAVARFGLMFGLSEPPPGARAPARVQDALPDLPEGVKGTVLFAESDLVAVSLPKLGESVAWKRASDPNIHSVGGPDRQGRVAIVVNEMMAKRHWLIVRDLKSGSETLLFKRPGDALWGDIARDIRYVSETVAISPTGGKVALGVNLGDFQIENPPALVGYGQLEIWDIAAKTSRKLGFDVADTGFGWFPDGKRLAVVELVDPLWMPPITRLPDQFMESFQSANRIPAISIVDTETGSKKVLHQGWRPIVSDDGKTILATDYEFNTRLIDVATGQSRTVKLPDFYGVAVAVLGSKAAIYLANQDPGEERLSQHNSPLVGPKKLPRIVYAEFGASEPKTIVSYIDPRWEVAYGAFSPEEKRGTP